MTSLRAAQATDAGRVRPTNQDLAFVDDELVVVADGMGGHAGGEIAAQTAVETLQRAFGANRTLDGLVAALERANRVVFERSEREADLRGMGTTLTAAALVSTKDGAKIGVVNVGDSRVYLLEGGRLTRLTEDHSLVEEMVRHGEISEAEAAVHPHRHILTRAVGIDRGVEIDSWAITPLPGMRLMLCSDGLTNECDDDEIATILADEREPSKAAQELVNRALSNGGSDNITVVVADIESPEQLAIPPDTTKADRGEATAAPLTIERHYSASDEQSRTSRAEQRSPAARRSRPAKTSGARPRPAPQQHRAFSHRPGERIVTARLVIWVFAFVIVIGGAFGFVGWYAKASYFVGLNGKHVAIFQGRPGGLLWIQPTLVEQTNLTAAEVFPPNLPLLQAGMIESSYGNAKNVVKNLANGPASLGAANTTTTSETGTSANSVSPPVSSTTSVSGSTSTTQKAPTNSTTTSTTKTSR